MDEKPREFSYFAHEAIMARMERVNKRLWILCIVVFFAFVVSNLVWIRYEMSMEDIATTITQDVEAEENCSAVISGVNVNGENQTDGDN